MSLGRSVGSDETKLLLKVNSRSYFVVSLLLCFICTSIKMIIIIIIMFYNLFTTRRLHKFNFDKIKLLL